MTRDLSTTVASAPAAARGPGAPLRVLVITPTGPEGGGEDWVLRLVGATDRLAPVVHHLDADGPAGSSVVGSATGGDRPGRRIGPLLGQSLRLRTLLRSVDPDVVLANGAAAGAAARIATAMTGHRLVQVWHEPGPRPSRRPAFGTPPVVTTWPGAEAGGAPGTPLPRRAVRGGLSERPEADVLDAAHRLAGVLAETAGRPGAGIDPAEGPPMSVVVPVWREGALVDDLVEALLPQLRPEDELVLVDDGSPDDTGERAERAASRHPQVRALRQTPNAGAGAARNAGVATARHAHIAFTDAGCHWQESWLDGLRLAFTETPKPDLVAGAYQVSRRTVLEAASAVGCYPDVGEVRRAGPLTTVWSLLFGRRFDPTRPAGRSLAVTRRALDAVGGWPETVRAHEDLDLSRAISERGLSCVLTTGAGLVWDQAGLAGTLRMYVRYGRGDAEASDRQALFRDVARAGAYAVGITGLALGGPRVRSALSLGGVAYLWVPVLRACREARPLATAAVVPLVIVAKDLAKVWGVLEVVRERALPRGRDIR